MARRLQSLVVTSKLMSQFESDIGLFLSVTKNIMVEAFIVVYFLSL